MAQQFSCYISCPVATNMAELNETALLVRNIGGFPRFWTRGSVYDHDSTIKDCDVFILMLPNNGWSSYFQDLPMGCRKELKLAISVGKKIFISYKSGNGRSSYATKHDLEFITAIAGTYDELKKVIYAHESSQIKSQILEESTIFETPEEDCESECVTTTNVAYDRRILLLMH